MKKVYLIQDKEILPFEIGEVDRIKKILNQNKTKNRFELTENFSNADLIILIESCITKNHKDTSD